MIKINCSFHLITFKNTLTLPDGRQIVFKFESKGGRIFLLWMIGFYIYCKYTGIDFEFWRNFFIGTGFAIVWDIFTAILYFIRLKIFTNKFKQ